MVNRQFPLPTPVQTALKSSIGDMQSAAGEKVSFYPVGVERDQLIVLSEKPLADSISLSIPGSDAIQCKVTECGEGFPLGYRSRLQLSGADDCRDVEVAIESTIERVMSGFDELDTVVKGMIQADLVSEPQKRMVVGGSLIMEVKTFGIPAPYELKVHNVSKTGLLVAVEMTDDLPFSVNTLLEIRIDPKKQFFETPLMCTGKVIRVTEEGESMLGIKITEMREDYQHLWEKAIADLEAKNVLKIG